MPIRNVAIDLRRLRRRRTPLPIRLPFPVTPELRIANLSPLPGFDVVRPVLLQSWADLPSFEPNVVAGTAVDFARLAAQCRVGNIDIGGIDHALVVVTRYGSAPLNDILRVTFWQAFGVPIFELYVGLDNGLLAHECEAHEGWHVACGVHFGLCGEELVLDGNGNCGLRTGLRASFSSEVCPCSHSALRLLDIEPIAKAAEPERRFAASA